MLDTNVLIDGFSDDFSAPARLIEAVRSGAMVALKTPAVEREYRQLLYKLIRDGTYRERILNFLDQAVTVRPTSVAVAIDDPDDYKFLEAAVGGQADLLVTNDQHLLSVDNVGSLQVVRPQEAWHRHEEENNTGDWKDFVRGLGIGR